MQPCQVTSGNPMATKLKEKVEHDQRSTIELLNLLFYEENKFSRSKHEISVVGSLKAMVVESTIAPVATIIVTVL